MRAIKAAIVIWAVLMCALGVAFCAFPYIEGNIKGQQIQQEVDLFKDRLETMPTEPTASQVETTPREHEELWNDMVAYNEHPILPDFYLLCEEEYQSFDSSRKHLYTLELRQGACPGIGVMFRWYYYYFLLH